jgi:hypothetical protein
LPASIRYIEVESELAKPIAGLTSYISLTSNSIVDRNSAGGAIVKFAMLDYRKVTPCSSPGQQSCRKATPESNFGYQRLSGSNAGEQRCLSL